MLPVTEHREGHRSMGLWKKLLDDIPEHLRGSTITVTTTHCHYDPSLKPLLHETVPYQKVHYALIKAKLATPTTSQRSLFDE